MVLALVVPVLMLALLIGMGILEERLFGAPPSSPPPLPNPRDRPENDPEQLP